MGDRLDRDTVNDIDAWLRDGGLVVTASERAARSLAMTFHRARRAEGLTAWPTPKIQDWKSFVRAAWEERNGDSRLVLNAQQEQALWTGVLSAGAQGVSLLEGPRNRLAALAMDAHALLCAYAPRFLERKARNGWDQDSGAFSAWLALFEEKCRAGSAVSAARLPLELTAALARETAQRPALLLAGFDHILPAQRKVFDAWGPPQSVREMRQSGARAAAQFHRAADADAELAACALWCRQKLAADPDARLLVVSQELAQRRGEIERAFLRYAGPDGNQDPSRLFEFSLGVPLGQVALARSAGLLLRWLSEPIEEHKLDWLISAGENAAGVDESRGLAKLMRELRRKGMQRTRWQLEEFLRQKRGELPPAAWAERMVRAKRRLEESARQPQSPLLWAELVPQLLETMGWPGARPQTSIEFQAMRRWQQVVDDCASLGFDGRRLAWSEFLEALLRTVDETLFAPESADAPVLIAGPAETAGLAADAIWFLGVDEDAWPPRGATHPLLPVAVQQEAAMPHAAPQVDLDLAHAMTLRLLASAPQMHFSYASQKEGADARPSRLVVQIAGEPQAMAGGWIAPAPAPVRTHSFDDASALPFPPGKAAGGAGVLTAQSQCPFKAFASARLRADAWDPAEAGLTAAERGTLLHAVLHSIWAGPPDGIRTHQELAEKSDLENFVADHVRRAFLKKLPARAREAMPARYLQLEEHRLTALVSEWLRYEQTRLPFAVAAAEVDAETAIEGLTLRMRLDRVDRLNDNSLLVIDYKSGDVSPKSWDLPRPDDVQLPLYAEFAVDGKMGEVGGLVFARIRAGEKREFAGRVKNPLATLVAGLSKNTNLVRRPLAQSDLDAWRAAIESLARDFLAGDAAVDPRDYPGTCERCGLQPLCRIADNPPREDDEEDDGEDGDE